MSDADYASFLDKANENSGGASAQQSGKSYGTKSVNTAVPAALEDVEEVYVSEADEPFEAVSLKFDGEGIDAGECIDELKKLLGHDGEVESVSEKEFDPRGQYTKVVDAVKKAGDGKVSIFSVDVSGTRKEYYVVSVDKEEGRVVGLKALAVES
ncbi:hypothetical protein K491DRAFT_612572 [Lophiostoma macrostomum CBS 122681]|uniref:Uncharacterized protein n=1 Tax=Lophiostoma macrostomum CBS 122681 TaxID=1314788 RepID=A0A6A6SNI9_9PLEO|nr:hypothetical protein K491DRAFT_612572 [Lophiostoma macrostomum CBS 122681]